MKILSVFGTRPEAIKMAPVIKRIEAHSEKFQSVVCVTAQHREMLDQVLSLFEISPDHDLNIMQAEQNLFDVTCNVLQGIKTVLEKERPDIVLVQGDTTTTFAASLAAFYSNIPIGHVEAGLRTRNKYAPFPEEISRKITSCIANLHFAPTEGAKQNLLSEGVTEETIHVTGNTVIDALLDVVDRIKHKPGLEQSLAGQFPYLDSKKKLILVTGHRRKALAKDLNVSAMPSKSLENGEIFRSFIPCILTPMCKSR